MISLCILIITRGLEVYYCAQVGLILEVTFATEPKLNTPKSYNGVKVSAIVELFLLSKSLHLSVNSKPFNKERYWIMPG